MGSMQEWTTQNAIVYPEKTWMPETPLPHNLTEHVENQAGTAADSRTRPRRSSLPGRPVSAFAPAKAKSDPPAGSLLPITPDDCSFVAALRAAGVATELDGPELARAAKLVRTQTRRARHLDLLVAYYDAGGDPLASRRRQATDRWVCYAGPEELSVAQLLARLTQVLPEISGSVQLQRVGGTLVLQAGDHVCALEDEIEEDDDLRTVSVRDVVRALNVLLDRHGVRARLVGLFGDGTREAYVSIPTMTAALPLVHADYLSVEDVEGLMEQTGW